MVDKPGVAGQHGDRLARDPIPETHGFVVGDRCEPPAVGTELKLDNAILVPLQIGERFPRGRVPESNRVIGVSTARRQPRAIGTESQTVQAGGVPAQDRDFLAGRCIP